MHDKKAYGQGLVGTFTEEFKKLGGKIVAAETMSPDETNFPSVVVGDQAVRAPGGLLRR